MRFQQVAQSEFVVALLKDTASFLSNAVYSGGATWLGTLISVVSAIIACKQAKKITNRVKREQNRKYVEGAQRALEKLNTLLDPVVMHSRPGRGIKADQIVAAAHGICHQMLSSPIVDLLPPAQECIANLGRYLTQLPDTITSAQANPPVPDPLIDLQQDIKAEIQQLSRLCFLYLDNDAATPD